MNLRPFEADMIRRILAPAGTVQRDAFEELGFLVRVNEEAPPLGERVFQIVCKLGNDARKEMDAVQKQRKALREQLGKKRLSPGEGPVKVRPIYAPTLNEYNALDKWKKGELCDAIDMEIDRLKKDWAGWSCGCIDRSLPGKKGTKQEGKTRIVRDGGRRRIVVVTRESSVRPDELALDSIGGKIPLDRLVHAGVLRGDTSTWLARYCDWKTAAPGEGKVTIDVHEVGE